VREVNVACTQCLWTCGLTTVNPRRQAKRLRRAAGTATLRLLRPTGAAMRCPDRGKRLECARREEAVCLHPPYRSHTQELLAEGNRLGTVRVRTAIFSDHHRGVPHGRRTSVETVRIRHGDIDLRSLPVVKPCARGMAKP
jgi:hypothetical protein